MSKMTKETKHDIEGIVFDELFLCWILLRDQLENVNVIEEEEKL